jgi:predicted HicB family RNase H-like nuclease
MMEYKGYHAAYKYDGEEGTFHAEVVNITPDMITFYGDTVEQLNEECRFSIDDYLAWCSEKGWEPAKPLSGNMPRIIDS